MATVFKWEAILELVKELFLKLYEILVWRLDRSSTHNSCEIKASEKNSGLNGIRAHDLCDACAVLYQLSYQANWELIELWDRSIPVVDKEYKRIGGISYIWTAEKDMKFLKSIVF